MGCSMSFLKNIEEDAQLAVDSTAADIASVFKGENQSHTVQNRYHSFAPPRAHDSAKWFVDGCGYFWALSVAIEEAQHEIWIMDWWLSPELYLRRPPSANEQYRLDRMLKAAADRGVKVNVMVYKEVEKVLTLSSEHTKQALDALSENISVFRHPDHDPSGGKLLSDFKGLFIHPRDLSELPQQSLEALYGLSDDVILFWAHHEKLCLIDGKMAFMGGLDACFGRWDTYQHSIADAHPNNVDDIIFPGQDFNNARIYDFQDVANFDKNKLDRTKSSRIGWSDLSVCLLGPIVEDLRAHFVQRWNFIFNEKYSVINEKHYEPLTMGSTLEITYRADGSNIPAGTLAKPTGSRASADQTLDTIAASNVHPQNENQSHHPIQAKLGGLLDSVGGYVRHGTNNLGPQLPSAESGGNVAVQLVRSSSRWSHGIPTEHSIANAYIEVIQNSQHFVYIENQFFITATCDKQHPVKNKIGAAIVERILRAAKEGKKYKVIVAIPSIPGFAGDLHNESSVGTLAIMNFQYKSICRGGNSIMKTIEKAGVDPKKYIQFYNLRNYDRINISSSMSEIERASGVSYETAHKEHDDLVGAGYQGYGERTEIASGGPPAQYDRYQRVASTKQPSQGSQYDTVSSSYMLDGPSPASTPWSGSPDSELDAFVSEELYIHTKCLIADDRVVIVGSANLNDRSQLGDHDSEIAVVIEDPTPIASQMNGQSFQASQFAASLRRQIFRKHLGLLPPQDCRKPDANFMPLDKDPNVYDWGSAPDLAVQDPLSAAFEELWTARARLNTEIFERAFRPVPTNKVRTWEQYEAYFGRYFVGLKDNDGKVVGPPKYQYGHVVKEAFPGGVRELTALLAQVRGSLVEMPLDFLCDVENLVKEGLDYNPITAEIYT